MPEPNTSKPTPTPNIEASIMNVKGLVKFLSMFAVLTNAQLFNASYNPLSSTIGVPIAHRPLPGGKNLKSNIYLNIRVADC